MQGGILSSLRLDKHLRNLQSSSLKHPQSMTCRLLFPFLALFPMALCGQIDGDNIFSVDQVIAIDLAFPQNNFWSLLEANYAADENEYIAAHLTLTDVSGTHAMDSVGVRLKGNSSHMHPGDKKSFKIDFNKYISGQNYDGLKKLNFSNGFKDPTCMREKLFFDVCREVGVSAPRANFAEVTFNGEPWGFYTVVEQIDDQFLDWNIQEDSGNLFKAGDNFGGGGPGGGGGGGAEANLVHYGDDQALYEERYELKSNEDTNDWSDLVSFLDFVNNTTTEAFAAGIDFRMDVDGFLRSAALDMLFSNLDTYSGSARNYYIYHNMDTNMWQWIKWDGNEAFGSYTNGAGNMETLAIDYSDTPRPLLENMLGHPDLYSRYIEHVCDLVDHVFNETHMQAQIDATAELIAPFVYADSHKMYSNNDFDTNLSDNLISGGGPGGGGPGGGTTYGLKSFVTNRASYVLTQMECPTSEVADLAPSGFTVYPNPATESIHVQLAPWSTADVRLINLVGQVLHTKSATSSGLVQFELGDLPSGTYVVEIVETGQPPQHTHVVVQ